MARLPLVDPASTSGEVREALDRLPVKLNIFRMMAHAESCMIPAMRFGGSILHRQQLSAIHRELLILQVACLEGGAYEWRQHVPIAEGVGVTKPQIAAIERCDFQASTFDEAERALLAFGRQVIETVRVDSTTFSAMHRHFPDRQIIEAIFAIGFYMTMARLTEATETDLDPSAGMAVYDGGKNRQAQS